VKKNHIGLLVLSALLSVSMIFNPVVCAEEQRRILSRNYLGLGLEVYAPYQCYPNESISVRVRVEALENLTNVSVTLFIWGSKSEGYETWSTSFAVLDTGALSKGEVSDAEHMVGIPADLSPGLTYGILSLDWSIYLQSSWEAKWDKASLRVTYVKNKDYESLETLCNDLQAKYDSAVRDLQSMRTMLFLFLGVAVTSAALTAFFAKRSRRRMRES